MTKPSTDKILEQINELPMNEVLELQDRIKGMVREKALDELREQEELTNRLREMVGMKKRPLKSLSAVQPKAPAKSKRTRKKKEEPVAETPPADKQEA